MGLAHEKKSYLQENANFFEIGSLIMFFQLFHWNCCKFTFVFCKYYDLSYNKSQVEIPKKVEKYRKKGGSGFFRIAFCNG